jgi:hypothetical protein
MHYQQHGFLNSPDRVPAFFITHDAVSAEQQIGIYKDT